MNTHAKRIGSGAFGAAVVYAAIHALMATPSSVHLAYSYSHIGDRAMIRASGSVGSREEEASTLMASLQRNSETRNARHFHPRAGFGRRHHQRGDPHGELGEGQQN